MIEQMVEGKTVAVVGPAAAVCDQSAEVDAHDVVMRAGFDHWPWKGYGNRVDVAVLDGHHSGLWLAGALSTPAGVPVLLKAGYDVPERLGEKCRDIPLRNPFQVTLTLWHLAGLNPASVSVFGADFYTNPHRAYTDGDYEFDGQADGRGKDWARLILGLTGTLDDHHPKQDLELIRQIRNEKGWPVGDERFMRVLGMSGEEYEAATAGWL
jgi:hypothetical protein